MNNKSSNRASFASRFILVLILSIIGTYLFYYSYGYIFAFLGPTRVILDKNPTLLNSTYTINNSRIVDDVKFDIQPYNPKPFLVGSNNIAFKLITSEGSINLNFPTEKLTSERKIDITDFDFQINNDFPDSQKICTSDLNPDITSITGLLYIDEFKESFKKLKISGRVVFNGNIDFMYSCAFTEEKEVSKIIDIQDAEIVFQLDSPVTYTWTGKGGPTYEL